MSKLKCSCGHIISDITNNLSYKGQILKDQDDTVFWETICKEMAEFISANVNNKKSDWVDKHFLPDYPKNLGNESIISDFLGVLNLKYMTSIYECESCGRLLVQEKIDSEKFVSYMPEDSKVYNILASEKCSKTK